MLTLSWCDTEEGRLLWSFLHMLTAGLWAGTKRLLSQTQQSLHPQDKALAASRGIPQRQQGQAARSCPPQALMAETRV